MKKNVTFEELGLSENTLNATKKKGFTTASEIQAKIIPLVLENKHDIIGISQTGSGKTGAFGLPIIDLIDENNKTPKVIILAPTRELALQVTTELREFTGKKRLNLLTVYGGSPIVTQMRELKKGVDIVIGTPGRVLDLIKKGSLELSKVEHFVLDEADEMLKMGFIEDIELIFQKTSKTRRVLLFSATMPPKIKSLSKKYMKDQIIVEVENKIETKVDIKQTYLILKREEKFDALCKIIDGEDFFYGIVFCMTREDVNDVTQKLRKARYDADCIHGEIPQARREKILKNFREQKINILVATDVAARGIDVNDLTHVINHSIPKELENYVHRIGRTARAGKSGIAISFISPKQKFILRDLEKVTNSKIEQGRLPSFKDIAEKKSAGFKKELQGLIQAGKNNDYREMAKDLVKEFGADEIVSALLSKINKREENEQSSSSGREGNDRGGRDRSRGSSESVRLFIAKGKDDNFGKKELFNFLEKESRIRIDGDSIKINGKFSFVNVPSDQADKIISAFSRRGGRPVVEMASEDKKRFD